MSVTFTDAEIIPVYVNVTADASRGTKVTRTIRLVKIDSTFSQTVEGAKFSFYRGYVETGILLGEFTTDADGVVTATDEQNYTYTATTDEFYYVLNYNQLTESMKEKTMNNPSPFGFSGDQNKLFVTEQEAKTAAESHIQAVVDELAKSNPYDGYTCSAVETYAPEGYIIDTTVKMINSDTVTVGNNFEVTATIEFTHENSVVNPIIKPVNSTKEQTTTVDRTVVFTKIDVDTGLPIEGAEISIFLDTDMEGQSCSKDR
ncbi:MAG: hypothetical protein SPK49_06005 [Erysipelotrichaceae bacterium]|nr:hypothetical protein [Erysipelotrichaceae bacterium]